MTKKNRGSATSGFRKFFFRGLAILLPSVLTIWILFVAYQFVQTRIAGPINEGIKKVVPLTPLLSVNEQERVEAKAAFVAADVEPPADDAGLDRHVRKQKLDSWWKKYSYALDLIGLVVAILLIYIVGATLGSIIGRRLYARGEQLISRVPLIKQVYPSVKQVTEFLVGPANEAEKMRFSRVVAVEYPRKGLWSVGLVTGSTMRMIQDRAGTPSLTVFVPSSPTPFTGYVITVPKEDTIDLPVTIEEALRFSVSAGVIVPPSQLTGSAEDAALKPVPPSVGRETA